MTTFRTGVVLSILRERPGLQRLEVRIDGVVTRAYNLTQLTGICRLGDEVVCNTTAVELGLGTGGWHVVHWNLANRTLTTSSPSGGPATGSSPSGGPATGVGVGHIMKLRYSSLQTNVLTAEEQQPKDRPVAGVPVIVCSLHSQMAIAAAAFQMMQPIADPLRLAYVMTDGAALAIAYSDLVYELVQKRILCGTVTAGHAFGGDYEAVTVPSAIGVAVHECRADAVIVAMGPGVVGTGSRLGTTAIEVAPIVEAAHRLGARPIVALRVSSGDQRARHRGVSHHTITALEMSSNADLAVPVGDEDLMSEISEATRQRHRTVPVIIPDPEEILAHYGLAVLTMGRGPGSDRAFFRFGAAAGVRAAHILGPS